MVKESYQMPLQLWIGLRDKNLDYSQCWVSGFSFSSLICIRLIMRRPEVNNFIAVSPQPNVYDFFFFWHHVLPLDK